MILIDYISFIRLYSPRTNNSKEFCFWNIKNPISIILNDRPIEKGWYTLAFIEHGIDVRHVRSFSLDIFVHDLNPGHAKVFFYGESSTPNEKVLYFKDAEDLSEQIKETANKIWNTKLEL